MFGTIQHCAGPVRWAQRPSIAMLSVLWPCSDASTPADGTAQRGTSVADSGTNALLTRAQTGP